METLTTACRFAPICKVFDVIAKYVSKWSVETIPEGMSMLSRYRDGNPTGGVNLG